MTIHPLAGEPASKEDLVDVDVLCAQYYVRMPDMGDAVQRVRFGPSGHRGSSLQGTFNEAHVLAITQAICDYRKNQRIGGPLYIGKDTHALSEVAFATALEVLAANRVEVMIDCRRSYTPTPAISHAIVRHNLNRTSDLADGIIITPSHNPPRDGGCKYNPPHGGPAGTDVTRWIERRANQLLAGNLRHVAQVSYERALHATTTYSYDYAGHYADDLGSVVDMDAIRSARLKVGVDALGGAGVVLWQPVVERYGIDLEVMNDAVDPTFQFMSLDWDGEIRTDCSSPYAMAQTVRLKGRFDIAFGNDADADRHGIVTRGGLVQPNQYLAAAIAYLFTHRPAWRSAVAIGTSVVSSSMIERVSTRLGRTLVAVPVGFKWFVPGLLDGSLGFGGEESGAASFLRRDGTVWVTDRDGIIMGLLAAELMARTGRDPSELYEDLTRELGAPVYERIDASATEEMKRALLALRPEDVRVHTLAGDPIQSVITDAPGNGVPIGGLKVVTTHGWFAIRPSGTEALSKLYAESFRGPDHLRRIQADAQAIISEALAGQGLKWQQR